MQVESKVMSMLHVMFLNMTIPQPTDFFFSHWHINLLFCGSYSN